MSNVVTNNINPRSGDSISINGSVSIGGTLTYEDVTNIDSVGIITAQSGIVIGTGTSIGNPTTNELGLYTNSSERIRIDSSGRLLVGISSWTGGALAAFVGNSSFATGNGVVHISRGRSVIGMSSDDEIGGLYFSDNAGNTFGEIVSFIDATPGSGDYPGRLVFSTTADGDPSPTERMRIDSTGRRESVATGSCQTNSTVVSASIGPSLYLGKHSGTAGTPNSGTTCFVVYANGNVQNTNNSYAGISDIKLKENIVDANSQWNDLKALQVRNYNLKEETGQQTHTQIGLIAQEVELVSPGLVFESPDYDEDDNDLGTVTKSVNYSVLYMKAVKALQEAMERIETLEAEVAALKGA